jgi:putative endonuclease
MAERGNLDRGKEGEEVAWRYLRRRGYTLLARNYRAPGGEVDLVVEKGKVLAFVEVKARDGATAEEALEAVDERKRERMARAARHFLHRYRGRATVFRFDVVAVLMERGAYRVVHIPEAFELEG